MKKKNWFSATHLETDGTYSQVSFASPNAIKARSSTSCREAKLRGAKLIVIVKEL